MWYPLGRGFEAWGKGDGAVVAGQRSNCQFEHNKIGLGEWQRRSQNTDKERFEVTVLLGTQSDASIPLEKSPLASPFVCCTVYESIPGNDLSLFVE